MFKKMNTHLVVLIMPRLQNADVIRIENVFKNNYQVYYLNIDCHYNCRLICKLIYNTSFTYDIISKLIEAKWYICKNYNCIKKILNRFTLDELEIIRMPFNSLSCIYYRQLSIDYLMCIKTDINWRCIIEYQAFTLTQWLTLLDKQNTIKFNNIPTTNLIEDEITILENTVNETGKHTCAERVCMNYGDKSSIYYIRHRFYTDCDTQTVEKYKCNVFAVDYVCDVRFINYILNERIYVNCSMVKNYIYCIDYYWKRIYYINNALKLRNIIIYSIRTGNRCNHNNIPPYEMQCSRCGSVLKALFNILNT